jgi:hypothetical protein
MLKPTYSVNGHRNSPSTHESGVYFPSYFVTIHFNIIPLLRLISEVDSFLLGFRPIVTLITVETGYNDIGLCDNLAITSDIPWYQLIHHL